MDLPRNSSSGWSRITALGSFLLISVLNPTYAGTWTGTDIGSVGVAGSDSYNSTTGVYTISGSGADINGTADAGHFVYQTLTGDGELSARMVSLQNTNASAKVGVMVRQSTAAGSINSFIAVTYSGGILAYNRTSLNGSTTGPTVINASATPYWLKIVKDGTLITTYVSPDGLSWTYAGLVRLTALTNPVQIGFALTSHNNTALCTATVDNITLNSQSTYAPTSPWHDQEIGTPGQAGQVHVEQYLWTLYGSGTGISGTGDGFHYAYQALSGNGVAIAQVNGLTPSTASAGVVMRQDLTAGSAEAGVLLNFTNGVSFATRASAGASVVSVAGAHVSTPYWVKLVRAGNLFYGYQSTDGNTWTLVGSQTISMTGTIYVGVAATTGSNTTLAFAVLDRVYVIPTGNYLNNGSISAGANHNLYLQPNGNVWAWGLNTNGQVGDGTTTTRTSPVAVPGLTGIISVCAGAGNSLALQNDGSVWVWGNDANGQLGDGLTTQRASPYHIPTATLSNIVAISAGATHSLALASDGTVWAWGNNANGQLGDGTLTQQTSPEHLTSLSGIVAISAGGSHSMALRSDGTVWVWGNNSTGQLGDGSTTQHPAPELLTTLSNVAAVSAGFNHSLVLNDDGTVWAWGDNSAGEVGDGTTTQRTSPVHLTSPNLTGITAIQASNLFSLALRNDGTVWTWGANGSGQLGINSTTAQSSPVQATGLTSAVGISAGTSHSLALLSGNSLSSWGDNTNGQLGTGTTTSSLTPQSLVPVITSSATPTGTTSAVVNYQITASNVPTSFNATGLPAWLSINSTGRIYSATPPTAPGTFSFSITATNLFGTSTTLPVTLTITSTSVPPSSGLTLWLKADAGISPGTNGQAVSQWNDQSPNANNAAQSNGTNQPVLLTTGLNGKPIIQFDGSNSWMQVANPGNFNLSTSTIFIVGESDNSYGNFIAKNDNTYAVTDGHRRRVEFSNIGYGSGADGMGIFYSQAINQNVSHIWEEVCSSSTSNLLICDGTTTTSTTAIDTTSFNTQPLLIGAAFQNYAEKLTGKIAEIIIYNRALTATEQSTVRIYLADKYGLYDPNATWPTSYSTAVQSEITRNQWNKSQADAYVTFLATNPVVPATGLVTWLKADAGVTPNGSTVSGWADQSPAGNTAGQSSTGNQPTLVSSAINGKPALSFDGTNSFLSIVDNSSLRAGQLTILAVVKPSSFPSINAIFSKPYYNTTSWNSPWVSYQLAQDANALPYFQSTLSGSPQIAKSTQPVNAGVSYLFSAKADGNTQTTWVSGVQRASITISGSIDYGDNTRKDVVVGGASTSWPWQRYSGQIAEVLFYNRALTTTEQQQAENYLANKYGVYYPNATWITTNGYSSAVQAEITRNQWNKSQAEAFVAFLATNPVVPATGLVTWLKADTLTGTNGSSVSTWADQSPAGNTAQSNSGNQPTLVTNGTNGKPAVSFNGTSSFMSIPDNSSLRPNNITIIALATRTGGTDYGQIVSRPYYSSSNYVAPYQAYGLWFSPSGQPFSVDAITGNESYAGGSVVNTGQPYVLSSVYDGASNSLVEGGTVYSTAQTGSLDYGDTSAKNIVIGCTTTNWQHQFLNGQVSEILIYNRALSTTERQQAELYLANKYAVYYPNATWITTSGYSSAVLAEITRNQWNKSQADAYVAFLNSNPVVPPTGLVAWLKADTAVGTDSYGVNQWVDQGPWAYVTTQTTNANKPQAVTDSLTGKPALRFNGNQFLSSSAYVPANQDVTIITAAEADNITNYSMAMVLGLNPGGGQSRGYGYRSNQAVFDDYQNSVQTGTAPQAGLSSISTVIYTRSNGAVAFYSKGNPNGTGTISVSDLTSGFNIGNAGWSGSNWTGTISEVLVYNRVLTATEKQQAEVYLANKYGLYHPSATWPTSYSTTVQLEIARNQWNKSQADAYVAFLATNPVVPPTGLVSWLKADAGITPNGSTVSRWADQSPNGNTAVQSSSGNQPTLVSSAINGHPALSFDGATSYLTIPDNPSLRPSNITILAVASRTTATDYGRIISKPYSSVSGQWNSPWVSYELSRDPSSVPYISTSVSGTDIRSGNGASMSYAAPYLLAATTDGSNEKFYQSGSLIQTVPVSGPIDNGDATRKDLVIGSSSTAWLNQSFAGQIAEILIYNRALSTTERQQAELYLANKYAVYYPNATWITTSGYSSAVQAEIVRNQWNKSQADMYAAFAAANPALPTAELALWLKADAGLPAGGSLVSQWVDQSLNHNNANQSSTGNQPTVVTTRTDLNGKPVVRFNGNSSWLDVTDSASLRPSNAVTIIAAAQTNSTASQALVCHGLDYNYYGEERYPNYSYDLGIGGNNVSFGSIGYGPAVNGTAAGAEADLSGTATQPQKMLISTMVYDGTNANGNGTLLNLYASGALQAGISLSNPILYNATPHDLTIGVYNHPGFAYPLPSSITNFFNGDVAEILVYNRALAPQEQQQAEVYLADKYGLYHPNATWPTNPGNNYSAAVKSEISRNQWNKSQADAYVAFLATNPAVPPTGLSLWLKGDSGLPSGGSLVSQWLDQSPNQNNANQSSTGNQPTVVTSRSDLNGKPVVRFNGSSSWLDVTDNASLRPTNAVTVIAVAQTNSTASQALVCHGLDYNYSGEERFPNYSYDLGIGGNNVSFGSIGYGPAVNGTAAGAEVDLTGPALLPQKMLVSTIVYDGTNANGNGTLLNLYASGTLQTSASLSNPILYDSIPHDLTIGVYNHPRFAYPLPSTITSFLNGDVAEILVYNRTLTPQEQLKAEVYLADKYGLYHPNATWPTNPSNNYSAAVQAEISYHQWNKSQADAYVAVQAANPSIMTNGLVSWFKADGLPSGPVSSWSDQLGNYTVSQNTSANQPTCVTNDVNGYPAIRFTGTQWLSNPANLEAGLNADLTIIEVGSTSNPTAQQYAVWLSGTGSGQGRALGYKSSKQLYDTSSISCAGEPVPAANVFASQVGVLYASTGGAILYQNGFTTGSGQLVGVQSLTSGLSIGAAGNQTSGWQGDIAEVMIYDHQLSTAELQQVNLYLANKYNLPAALPAPTISPGTGSYPNAQTITMSSIALNQANIYYTTDGSIPTASSTVYTTPFTLSSNAVINAAIFRTDQTQLSPVTTVQYVINSTAPPSAPPLPTALAVAVNSAGGELDLSWLIGTGTYTAVDVYRSDNGGAYNLIATLDAGTTSYADQNVVSGVNYQYEVGTLNASGAANTSGTAQTQPASLNSVTISVTTPSNALALP